jgi:O-glycosyl hydrolase
LKQPSRHCRAVSTFEQLESRKLLAADLPAIADAYVRDGASANLNFGAATTLIAKKSANLGNTRQVFVRFDIASTSIAAGQAVKLRLYGKLADTQDNNLPVAIYPVENPRWTETDITWNTQPQAGSVLDTETVTGTSARWYEWDVTDYVIDEKTNGRTFVGFTLRSTNRSDTQIVFNSQEGATNDPVLRVSDPVVTPPPPVDGATTTIPITTAAYVRGGASANTNFGAAADLVVKRSGSAGNVRETYLQFDLSAVSTITTAKLRLFGGLTTSGSVQVNVYSAGNGWSEGGITYNSRPSTGTGVLTSKTLTSATKAWHEFDLTTYLKSEKAAGRNVVAIAIKAPNITDPQALFNSDDAASNRPEVVITSGTASSGRPVTANVNYGDDKQTIEGFGSAMISWIPKDPNVPPPIEYEDPKFYDKIVGDLGASIARIPIWPTFEGVNDDDDPNHFNWAGFDDAAVARTLTFLQRLKDRGVTRFMATVWTPPAWMKTNGSVYDGGMIRPDLRAEFAEYIAAFAIVARDQFGIQMTAVSVQNEPLFVQSYESAIMTPEQFREVVRSVRRKLDAEGLSSVKILMPEDVASSDRFDWYVSPTMNDAETADAVGALAAHGTKTNNWNSMSAVIDKYNAQDGTPFWLTEASGHTADWAGALDFGTTVHDALTRGDAAAYLYWQWTERQQSSQFSLMVDGNPTAKYYVAKHFYRYIRPDAVRYATSTNDAGLRIVSFKDAASGAVTHVLINTAATAADVTINLASGSGLPASYKQYRSSASENHVQLANVTGGASVKVSLPASSIVTLYSGPELTTPAATSGGPLPGVQRVDVGPYTAYDSARSDALRDAAMRGDLADVQALIAGGANVNATSDAGWTALHAAAASPYAGAVSVINALISAGATLNKVTNQGWTALHVAAANGTTANGTSSNLARDKVNALLNGGLKSLINAKDSSGRTALHWAGYVTKLNLSSRTEDATVVNALLTGGANKSLLDDLGKTARDYALAEGNGAAASALA